MTRPASRLAAVCAIAVALLGCESLKPSATAHPTFYALDGGAAAQAAPSAGPTLIVNPPHAAAGYDSARIIYVRQPHQLEYFSQSEWVDPPARMLAPLLVAALQASGAFRAVVLTPSAAAGDLRLDTEIVRLQHEFAASPSRVRFTLRATLVEDRTRRVVATREFDLTEAAASENPYGGVVAANREVQAVLVQLAAFCAQAAPGAPAR